MTQTILAALTRGERLAIAGTYALTLLENLCMLAYPALTGWAIDDLLRRSYRGLAVLIAVWLAHLVASFVRQRCDTRVFLEIYARLAVDTVAEQSGRGHGTGIVSARVEMMRERVGFFEADVPAMFTQVVTVIGSLVMLFTYDLEAARLLRLRRHFGRVRRWHVQLSDSESWTWTVTELATIAALVAILIDFTRSPSFSAGAIYAILAYVFDYLEGLDNAPALVNNIARLQDISTRLAH